MAELITKTADYDEIREHLAVSASEIPDAAIKRPSVVDVAEAKVFATVPDWESLPNEQDEMYLRAAVIHYVCYLLAPRLPLIVAQYESDNKTIFARFKGLDLTAVARQQFGRYKACLKSISSYTAATDDKLIEGSAPAVDQVTGD